MAPTWSIWDLGPCQGHRMGQTWAKANLAQIWPIPGVRPGAGLAHNKAFIYSEGCVTASLSGRGACHRLSQ